jgi:hypothetical protein
MFGWGVGKERSAILSAFAPLTRAFLVQLDELRRTRQIPLDGFDKLEGLAFAAWLFHFAIMNTGKSRNGMRKLQIALNDAANEYVRQMIVGELASASSEEKLRIYDAAMSKFMTRANEYNDAFNRDKVRSFSGVSPLEEGKELRIHFATSLVSDPRHRAGLINSPVLTTVIFQFWSQVFDLFGLKHLYS